MQLLEPNWTAVVGGSVEADWIEDKNRKLSAAGRLAEIIEETSVFLEGRGAIAKCSPEILSSCPFAADWYMSLAGFSQKTLSNIREAPRAFGLSTAPLAALVRFRNGKAVRQSDASALCAWLNDEIERSFPSPPSAMEATLIVALILGGRIIGQGQNLSGNIAVTLTKRLIVQFYAKSFDCEVGNGSVYSPWDEAIELQSMTTILVAKRLIFSFILGGNRPDMVVKVGTNTVAVAEIKGRKDESNTWESWMPQVVAHMRTWRHEFPKAVRLFFGTLITADMVNGSSAAGTRREGLRDLYEDGSLAGAFNISSVATHESHAVMAFEDFLQQCASAARLVTSS